MEGAEGWSEKAALSYNSKNKVKPIVGRTMRRTERKASAKTLR